MKKKGEKKMNNIIAIAWRWKDGDDMFLATDLDEVRAVQKYVLYDLEYNNMSDKNVDVITVPISIPRNTIKKLAERL